MPSRGKKLTLLFATLAVVVLGVAALAASDTAEQVDGRPDPVRVRHLQLHAHGVVGVEQGGEVDEVQLEAFGEARQEGRRVAAVKVDAV